MAVQRVTSGPLRRFYAGRNAARAVTIGDLRAMARRRLPAFAFEYLEGGAEQEVTLAANRAAFDSLRFVPRVLTGNVEPPPTDLFGERLPIPLVVAPTGFNALFWPQGDLAVARAAARAGIPFTQSTVSNVRIEDICRIHGLSHWMQLYVFKDIASSESLIDRAQACGSRVLVVTVDANIFGNREWDRRLYRPTGSLRWPARLECARHLRWFRAVFGGGIPGFANLYDFLPQGRRSVFDAVRWTRSQIEPALSWRHITRLRARWKGPFLIKGVCHPDDAARAVEIGADGIVLSNHGGRQLDGSVSGPELIQATRDRIGPGPVVLVDGGVRRGSDVLKSVLLGANAVLAGRAVLYGLAAAGETGVERAVAILAEEYRRSFGLFGGGELVRRGSHMSRPKHPADPCGIR